MVNKINKQSKIQYIKNNNYIIVKNKNREDLEYLKKNSKIYLRSIKYPLMNKSTGYIAKINSRSVGKMLYPAPFINPFIKNYIDNLNALLKLKELFENSIYIDTLKPMKGKQKNPNIIGFHHFIAPLIMNNKRYRVLITAREKKNSNILYVISSEVYPLNFSFLDLFNYDYISLKRLIKNTRIYNYELDDYQVYNINDVKFDDTYINEDKIKYSGI